MKKFLFLFFFVFLIGNISGESTDFFASVWTLDFDACCTPNFLYAEDLSSDKKIEIIIGSPTKISIYDSEGNFKWEYKTAGINAVYVSEYTKKDEKDIIVGTKEGYVYVLDYSGRVKFRQDFTDWITSFFVSDVDGDGNKELIIGSRDKNVYVLSSDRKVKWKFETGGSVISVNAADINGDGIKEVLAGSEWSSRDKNLGGIYVLKNGELKWSKQADGPVSEIYFEGGKVIALAKYKSILVFDKEGNSDWKKENKFGYIDASDVNNDGNAEIIASSYPYVYAYDLAGNEKWKYSVENSVTSLYSCDLHNDGLKEILAGTEYGATTIKSSDLYVISGSGNLEYVSKFENRGRVNAIVVNDINKDNKKEVLLGFLRDRIAGGEQHITDGSVKVLEVSGEYAGKKESPENEAVKNEETQKKEYGKETVSQKSGNEGAEKKQYEPQVSGQENPSDNTIAIIAVIALIIMIAVAAVFLIMRNKGKKSDYKNKEKPAEHTNVKEVKETEKKTEEKETKEKTPVISDEVRPEGPEAKQ